jgi:hypothetical protein
MMEVVMTLGPCLAVPPLAMSITLAPGDTTTVAPKAIRARG